MTNEEKLQKLKDFLDENNLEYHDNSKKKINNLHILKYHINVHISDKYDEVFFQRMKGFSPVFIRDDESADFIIEKVQSTIINVLKKYHKRFEKMKAKEARKLQFETKN